MRNWHLLYTKPHKEPLVHAQLDDRGYEVFFPYLQRDRGYNRGVRLEPFFRNIFSSMQGAYVRQLSLEHDPHGVEGIATAVDELLSNQGVRQVITSIKPDWRPEFRKFVDLRLAAFASPSTKEID